MTRALIPIPGKGTALAEVDVYQDGEGGVVVRGRVAHSRQVPHGQVTTLGQFETRFTTMEAYNWTKARAFERNPALYSRVVGILGVDDDASRAPMLPRLPPRRPLHEVDDEGAIVAEVKDAESRNAVAGAPLLLAANDDDGRR